MMDKTKNTMKELLMFPMWVPKLLHWMVQTQLLPYLGSFNTNGIVYDNTPWRPGREMEFESSEEDERKLKNLATRILSNGVEVLVKDKNSDVKQEQRKLKVMHIGSTMKPTQRIGLSPPHQSLISSAVATVVSRQQINAMFPLHQLMQHNYIIKTCMTTYTYLTTVIQNKRSAVSTFETTVSVVTTESLTNLFASELADLMPTKTKYIEMKTIQPSVSGATYQSSLPKIDKRIDNNEEDFDFIQPSEVGSTPCTNSCSCSQTKTEGLKTSQLNAASVSINFGMKTPQYGLKFETNPSNKDSQDTKAHYSPYEYENSQLAPTDRIVEKYTEVINDYSEEKESNSVEASDLLTNEQAPHLPLKQSNSKVTTERSSEKPKPGKPQKVNKNKFVVADLLKLGSLGIKGLSQLAPVFEKMTGGFIRRQDNNKTTTTTTGKPVTKITPYVVNKRVDTEVEYKPSTFPIYIPVDEMETSESQIIYTNATLHQNLVWAAEHKQPKAHIVPPRIVHESPLVNGGIPISPGEIIRANSDVIVGKPAVGGPLTLAASGIKLHNQVNPPALDSIGVGNEEYIINDQPYLREHIPSSKIDDSYDLRPPLAPKQNYKPIRNAPRPAFNQDIPMKMPQRPTPIHSSNDHLMKTEKVKSTNNVFINHGRPAFLDYIPSLGKPNTDPPTKQHINFNPVTEDQDDILDNSPSSSEMFQTRVTSDGKFKVPISSEVLNKPLLVDIQPSKVANVLIPHGSSTALVFAGSSEPHKTGDYIDDPLPYPEPGYFGSFSIDAPQLTNVHNVAPNNGKKQFLQNSKPLIESYKPQSPPYKDQSQRYEPKYKWKDSKLPMKFSMIPPPTSKQETHLQVGPQITVYNPEIYNPQNNFEKYHHIKNKEKQKDAKEIIDRDYENYLAVPPPPPKTQHNHDFNNKNKPYSQRPIVHTKPVQDMKVFLNIQHPVPNSHNHEQVPTKVTSEIYYAEQQPNFKPNPTYTVHIPPSPPTYTSNNNAQTSNSNIYNYDKIANVNSGHSQNSFSIVSSPNFSNKTILEKNMNDNDNTYTVTLNTATNVASNVGDSGQVIGSSMPVAVDTSNSGAANANIPIGTNFAIKVENSPHESYNKEMYDTPTIYEEHSHKPYFNVAVGDNRWNESTNYKVNTVVDASVSENVHAKPNSKKNSMQTNNVKPSFSSSQNSHANSPMVNNYNDSNKHDKIKPVVEFEVENNKNYDDSVKTTDQKRPGKRIPNIPTNSHGWYSSLPINENGFDSMNNIKVEFTTRKVIPLLHNYNKHSVPEFGQKVTSVGKPPTEFYAQNTPSSVLTHHGKPFSKSPQTEKTTVNDSSYTKTYNSNYVISNFGIVKQPAYDIPIRDNSDETTTTRYVKPTTENIKPVYENSDEVYDGKEVIDINNDDDGDGISSESMKVPVLSASVEENIPYIKPPSNHTKNVVKDIVVADQNKNLVQFNPGTQTEKPFKNKTNSFQSNAIKPIYSNNSHMRPRPFTSSTLDHQLHQPHWQINQMMENSTNASYEENLELNMGEEMSTISTFKPSTHKNPYQFPSPDSRYKNPRPVFSLKFNNSHGGNDSIITSTIHINNKKPLIIRDIEKSTLPSFTMSGLELNRSTSEIIDMSPPPPTMDYSFKPSTHDETIMGMSPPPPRTPPARSPPRSPPTLRPMLPQRTPPPYRSKPPRTLPPRPPTQRPTRKPINRDEISTYRPAYDINNMKKPYFNRDQPSSLLLPPPRDISSDIKTIINDRPFLSYSSISSVVFPTPISSGWLTSSGVEFSSSFDFGPTSVQSSYTTQHSEVPNLSDVSINESSNEFGAISSSEENPYGTEEKPSFESSTSKENSVSSSESTSKILTSSTDNVSDLSANESSQEDISTEKSKVNVLGNKHRTRKPYPIRNNEKKTNNNNKYKSPTRPVSVIRPTSVLSRPDLLNPTRHISIKKIARPLPSRPSGAPPPSIIESSESSFQDEFIKPTEVLKEHITPTIKPATLTPILEKTPVDFEVVDSDIRPVHHGGNEIKIVDEIIPTKTEFRTTVVTLTKTLSEPPKTVSSIGYVNLTHTLTVTHTKTSLISKSEGSVTQTLVLTNTQTSTIIDVITEIYTQVQPTTIVETVTKHIQIPKVEPTPVQEVTPTSKVNLDDITMSSEEENLIIRDHETTENVQKVNMDDEEGEGDGDTFFVVMNKSQGGGAAPPITTDIDTGDYDGVTRNEQVNSNGVSQVLFGEILLAGTPYLETNVVNPPGLAKECQPDCKASRNERCQRIDGLMKCVCRPGFARMFPDRPCKPTYTYSVRLALSSQANERLVFHGQLADNSSKHYQALALAAHEGINRMVMQSDLRDVFHGVHITGFHPVEMTRNGEVYNGVMNDFYVQLSDNAHESRLKEVIEKYLRNNNYSLGGTDVHASGELMEKLEVNDFDECLSSLFHDCSEHAQCFNLRGTYTCSCVEGYADLSVNTMYPGRICSAEPVGCERCNYHGTCYSRDDLRVLCECFQWYSGSSCHINLKVVLISLVVCGGLLTLVLAACGVMACSRRPRPPPRSVVTCIQAMPSLHQGAMPSKQRADRRALISERGESGDGSSIQNASLPYMPSKRTSSSSKKCQVICEPPSHEAPPPPPAPAVMIPRARLHPQHADSRENISRKKSMELSNEDKLISYLESGAAINNDEMRRKHSMESSYSANTNRYNKQGALVSAGFKVSTTVRPDESTMQDDRDDMSSMNKGDLEDELARYNDLRKSYSQDELSEWTDAERRIGDLTLSEARSVGGTLPASTGRAASSTRLTHQEANTMAERDLGSTFLLPHVHLYKPDLTSDVSEFDSL